jgi:uncharacterized membrane protein YfcA
MTAASGGYVGGYSAPQLSEEERARILEHQRRKRKWLAVWIVLFIGTIVGSIVSSIVGRVAFSPASFSVGVAIFALSFGIIVFVKHRQRVRFENRSEYMQILQKINEEGRSRYSKYF